MSIRLARPCRAPGCLELQPCGKHPIPKPFATAHRRSIYGVEHRRWRALVLQAHPICQWLDCWQRSTDADHIDPHGPRYSLSNGQGLCAAHHRVKTGRETRR